MTAQKIDGKAFAADLRGRIAEAVTSLKAAHDYQPTLAVVLVGDDPASHVYVRNKIKFTTETGMRSVEHRCDANIKEADLIALVQTLNADQTVDGILVQLPLPKHLDADKVIAQINPDKDVDGLTEVSAGRLSLGKPGLRPCTPTGCVMLAKDQLGDLSGKHCVIIGRSILVGKPAAMLFLEQNCTVTIAHSRTKDIEAMCREADVLVAAVGRPEMVKASWVKPGACVIDVGINRVPNPKKPGKSKLVGDVDYRPVTNVAGSATPVPGGVGPMTIACLLRNTVLAACQRKGWDAPDVIAF
ncbi:MAG: bifunctional methylenetetrahydrofolate dehydrogenase/methenyltetrahydrofolate cyclohydrolase FolD [Alphaproteobacteria bacterium]